MARTIKLRYNGKQTMIAGAILMAVAVSALVFSLVQGAHFKSMESWPVIKADVTSVFEDYDYEEDIILNYAFHAEFMVEGSVYSGTFTQRNHPGGTANLIYNPQNPREAYLASDPPTAADYLLIVVISGALGIAVFCSAFKVGKVKKKRKH